jgi:hypothetical protein
MPAGAAARDEDFESFFHWEYFNRFCVKVLLMMSRAPLADARGSSF